MARCPHDRRVPDAGRSHHDRARPFVVPGLVRSSLRRVTRRPGRRCDPWLVGILIGWVRNLRHLVTRLVRQPDLLVRVVARARGSEDISRRVGGVVRPPRAERAPPLARQRVRVQGGLLLLAGELLLPALWPAVQPDRSGALGGGWTGRSCRSVLRRGGLININIKRQAQEAWSNRMHPDGRRAFARVRSHHRGPRCISYCRPGEDDVAATEPMSPLTFFCFPIDPKPARS